MDVDLFISHSSSDAEAARALRADLEAAGYSCYLAPDDVVGTEPWAEQILGAIGSSRVMLVLLSAAALRSRHVAREVELASSRGRTVVPIRLEPVTPGGSLEYHLTGMQRIDAFPPPMTSHRDRILRRLGVILGTGIQSASTAGDTSSHGATPMETGGLARPRSSVPDDGPFAVDLSPASRAIVQGGGTTVIPPRRSRRRWLVFASRGASVAIVVAATVAISGFMGLGASDPTVGPSPSPTPATTELASLIPSALPTLLPTASLEPSPAPTPTPRPTKTPKPPSPTVKPPPPPTPTPVPATKPAKITSHVNGATISGTSATFAWSAATGAKTVKYYSVYVGSNPPADPCQAGSYCQDPEDDAWASSDIGYAGGMLPGQLSVRFDGLPADGSTIYVRLFTKYNPETGILTWRDYAFISAP